MNWHDIETWNFRWLISLQSLGANLEQIDYVNKRETNYAKWLSYQK